MTAAELHDAFWLEVATPAGASEIVVLDAADRTTLDDLRDELTARLDPGSTAALTLFSARLGRPLSGRQTVESSDIRVGDRLVLCDEAWAARRPDRTGEVVVQVVGGPGAGTTRALRHGTTTIGRDGSGADISVHDPTLSRRHVVLERAGDRITVSDGGSSNGTFVNGSEITGEVVLSPGDLIEAGHSLFVVTAGSRGPRRVHRAGRVAFDRAPRVATSSGPPPLHLPAPPPTPDKPRFPLIAALGPLVMGIPLVAFSAVQSNTTLLLMGVASLVLSPLLAVGYWWESRHEGRHSFTRRSAEFRAEVDRTAQLLADAVASEVDRRRALSPGLGELIDRALVLSDRLWERRPSDADFLEIALGWADQSVPVDVEVEGGGDPALRAEAAGVLESRRIAHSLPVTISLPECGVVAWTGDDQASRASLRGALLRLAVLHSPRDVVIAACHAGDEGPDWTWLDALPHCRSTSSPLDVPHVVAGQAGSRALCDAVLRVVEQRAAAEQSRFGGGTRHAPALVLVATASAGAPANVLAAIAERGPSVSVHLLWFAPPDGGAPAASGAVVTVQDEPRTLDLLLPTRGEHRHVSCADGLDLELATLAARALTGVTDASAGGAQAAIPTAVRLLELLGLEEPTAAEIERRWDAGRELDARLGATAGGPFSVDLRRDGPHALVGGTTGAGKSELLQTWVASLASAHSPERLTFLLVDYKGGAAFKDCVQLPHTVGMVTDLDPHLVNRVLVSLNAELRRREHVLSANGCKDLPEMETRVPGDAPPSLVLVVDEFATLAKELPDFVDGVVNIAQRGRSLGIHLVLATQRPAGAINDNVRANTNLRIALRMNDADDSRDVIDDDLASRLPRTMPGRAYVRTGRSELTAVQIGYGGGERSIAAGSPSPRRAVRTASEIADGSAAADTSGSGRSELQELVAVIRDAARRRGIAEPPRPWLEPLATVVPLADLAPAEPDGPVAAVIGVVDLPAQQRQEVLTWHPEVDGSVAIYGASGAGKSTVLRTIGLSLARRCAPGSVHLYGVDFASRGLDPLAELPHVGSIIQGGDIERVQRLITMLEGEVERRKELLATAGVSSLAALPPQDEVARIVVLLDGFAGFVTAFEKIDYGEWIDRMAVLVGEGRAYGVHIVYTAHRRGAVPQSVASTTAMRIVLRMTDPDDYTMLGLDPKAVAGADLPPGRGFVGTGTDVQVAVVGTDGSPTDVRAEVEALVASGPRPARRAPAVVSLPERVDAGDLPRPTDRLHLTLGLRGRDLGTATVSLEDSGFLIAGPPRSGRSNALRLAVEGLRTSTPDAETVLFAPRRSPLLDLDGWARVARGRGECESLAEELDDGLDLDAQDAPLIIVVDDGTELADTGADSSLDRLLRRGGDSGLRLVAAVEATAAGRSFSGFIATLRLERHGLLLDPDVDIDGDLLGVRLPRSSTRRFGPGRGFLVTAGATELVQVALV